MAERGHRAEITLSELTYRGDRDERLTNLTVSGEGETPQKALYEAFVKLAALGLAPTLIFENEGGARL